ncbi:hypothetical protein GH714_017352 [Hevea brasiliensis]|uniref:Phosphofructokinase domain-containing protein n=1 Tax=Hevea brasiliensis TaxID=3981 RepID=A0A6A6NI49_HEVBR|nr:hypothetical protein GH714_017352 [Hevea brasiliensis]
MDSDFGIPRELSELQKLRSIYEPDLPPCLQGTTVRVEFGDSTTAADAAGARTISRYFPTLTVSPWLTFLGQLLKVGIVFCGRQSPGGHNVVWGLLNALKIHNPNSTLLGFLGGSEGLFAQRTLEITDEVLSTYKNQGVTSNTDAAQLAETFAEAKCSTKVVGVPVTLNGDLKNQFVETNVGFDTICKVNSQLISNVCTDALSAEKYYYFIRLMGRKASHVALECTLQSHPNMVILGEEVAASKLTLFDLTKQICDAVQVRAEQDKYHGVILLPEGLIESIPEVYALLKLLLYPESDDSAQLSQIETEKLLAHLVQAEMSKRLKEGTYKGKKFNAICHFFGYQARGSVPSKFDCDYAYVLGHICYHILAAGLNGYMATVTNLKNPVNKWRCGAAPITAMMTVKRWAQSPGATSIGKPAIHPAAVDLKGKAYELLRENAIKFLMDDLYRNPGPLQFEGPGADAKPLTLCVEDQDYMGRIKKLQDYLDKVLELLYSPNSVIAILHDVKTMVLVSKQERMIFNVPTNEIYTKVALPSCKIAEYRTKIESIPFNRVFHMTVAATTPYESRGGCLVISTSNVQHPKDEEISFLLKTNSIFNGLVELAGGKAKLLDWISTTIPKGYPLPQ